MLAGPHPARSRAATTRGARAAGASHCSRGPTPARSRRDYARHSDRRRFSMHAQHSCSLAPRPSSIARIAQYRRVELKILGMDCAICAHGVRVAVQKVAGVESVELSLERAQADIRLIKDNRVSLDQFRKIVKGNGFEPRQATVTAIGTVREVDGKLAFEVSGVAPSATRLSRQERNRCSRTAQEGARGKEPCLIRNHRSRRDAGRWSRMDCNRERQIDGRPLGERYLLAGAGC